MAVYDATDLYLWGMNLLGQLGDGTTEDRWLPTRSYNPDRVLAVVAGWCQTVAVAITGTTSAWGWNHFGQLGNRTTANGPRAVRVPGIDAHRHCRRRRHTLAITARGR